VARPFGGAASPYATPARESASGPRWSIALAFALEMGPSGRRATVPAANEFASTEVCMSPAVFVTAGLELVSSLSR
jgi:hypothetical protein